MEVLIVEASGVRCGLPVRQVSEVLRAAAVTPLPGAPTAVDGVVNVRGSILPVFDLAARMGMPRSPVEPDQRLVVATAGEHTVVLRVETVLWFHAIDAGDLEDPGEPISHAGFLRGVARLPDGLALIHDLERFLSMKEAEALDIALSTATVAGDSGS